MMYYIVGLGNPEPEFSGTWHNIGRVVVQKIAKSQDFSEWEYRKEHSALVSHGIIEGKNIMLIEPDNYMNNSGLSLRKLFNSDSEIENMIVIHDDIDRLIGKMHVSFNRGAGGHKGVQSIIDVLKTKQFSRIRLGIAPSTPLGRICKPKGVKAVAKYVVGRLSKKDIQKITPVVEKSMKACFLLIEKGVNETMNDYN